MLQPGWDSSLGENGHICMAETLCCPTETITTSFISYTPIQNLKVQKKKKLGVGVSLRAQERAICTKEHKEAGREGREIIEKCLRRTKEEPSASKFHGLLAKTTLSIPVAQLTDNSYLYLGKGGDLFEFHYYSHSLRYISKQ